MPNLNINRLLNFFGYYRIKWADYLSEDKAHLILRCKYMGYWLGVYDKNEKLIDETCGYAFRPPRELYEHYIECNPLHAKEVNFIQIKYFLQAICMTDHKLHTFIYEANVNKQKVWWTYGQPILDKPVGKIKEELEKPRWVIVIPFKHKGKIIRWLAIDSDYPGYNIHCHKKGFPIFSPDMSGTQYFVKKHFSKLEE